MVPPPKSKLKHYSSFNFLFLFFFLYDEIAATLSRRNESKAFQLPLARQRYCSKRIPREEYCASDRRIRRNFCRIDPEEISLE